MGLFSISCPNASDIVSGVSKKTRRKADVFGQKQCWNTEKNGFDAKTAFWGWEWGFGGTGIGKNTDQKRAQTNYK
jgi:hypothetical protein